ncbi:MULTISPECIES: hypothetical protein [Ralstonia solanacearum species complex]|uniref:hypothetical protein n=1 Tax=Ralstonia solanacearum species complex TaxID=3116862 RepID=UPI0008F8D5CD|nr:hypothetical protein [Ralstonia pseudosolanacearum]MCK4121260.1 hypothetical protein [Ralstonia pseudosolanacearum]MCK4164006.1 hypothetical protein [Ralstonia pseudosolanacearum]OIN73161.1 hypothetical protein BL248_15335 [Ralstonia solanacearum]
MPTKVSIDDWLLNADRACSEIIHHCRTATGKDRWNENLISAALLYRLEQQGKDIVWAEHPQRTLWEGYKYVGKAEQNYGDIAVFVTVLLTEEVSIEGVAFYEAKRQYFDGARPLGFKMLEAAQLERIWKTTTASHVLLYDHVNEDEGVATAVPTKFALELLLARDARDVSTPFGQELHGYGLPWVQRLGNNLRGFDLDFSEEAVKKVKEYVEQDRIPTTVVNVVTTHVPQLTLELKPYLPPGQPYRKLASFGLQNRQGPSIKSGRSDDGPSLG